MFQNRPETSGTETQKKRVLSNRSDKAWYAITDLQNRMVCNRSDTAE